MQIVISLNDQIEDEEVLVIYKALGFVRAGKTEPMWIYAGNEH